MLASNLSRLYGTDLSFLSYKIISLRKTSSSNFNQLFLLVSAKSQSTEFQSYFHDKIDGLELLFPIGIVTSVISTVKTYRSNKFQLLRDPRS